AADPPEPAPRAGLDRFRHRVLRSGKISIYDKGPGEGREPTMELSELWDKTTDAFSAATEGISNGLVRVFGNANERAIRRLRPRVARINEMEPRIEALSDEQLKSKTAEFRARLADGATLDEILEEAFAVCREAGRR